MEKRPIKVVLDPYNPDGLDQACEIQYLEDRALGDRRRAGAT